MTIAARVCYSTVVRTVDARLHRHVKRNQLIDELSPSDLSEMVALLRPTLRRIERGELRVTLSGALPDARELGAFQTRFPELVSLLLESRG